MMMVRFIRLGAGDISPYIQEPDEANVLKVSPMNEQWSSSIQRSFPQ